MHRLELHGPMERGCCMAPRQGAMAPARNNDVRDPRKEQMEAIRLHLLGSLRSWSRSTWYLVVTCKEPS